MTAAAVDMMRCMQDRNRYLAHRVEALERALAKMRGACTRCDKLPADCRCDPCQRFLDDFAQIPAAAANQPPAPTLAQRARARFERALRKVL